MPHPAESASAAVPPGAASGPARLATAAGLAALALVTFMPPSATRLHGWPFAGVAVGLALVPIALASAGLLRAGDWRLPPPLLSAGAVLLAAAALASALASPFSAASLPRVWPTLGGVALFFALYHTWSVAEPEGGRRRETGARALAFAGALLAIGSFVLWARGRWPLPWLERNTAPFGHSTYTGGAVVLLIPWLTLQAWATRGRQRLGWIAVLLVAGIVLASTSSRGAVLALGAAGAAGAAAIVSFAPWSRRRKALLAAAALAVIALGVATNPRLRELVVHQRWGESARESNTQRAAMLDAGMRLGAARPLTGWGPGTVPLAYPRVRAALDGGTENVLQLHSTAAQMWATSGGTGIVALLLLLVGAGMAFVRAPRTPATLAAAASLGGYGLFTLTDHQLDVPFFSATGAAILAWLAASARPDGASSARGPRLALGLGIVLAAGVAVPATWSDLRARRHYDAALTALGENDGAGYLRALDAATAAAPHDPYFAHRAALWLVEQRPAADPARSAAVTREAADRLERSLATGAHEEFAHFNLGWIRLDFGEGAGAARHFIAAARLVPDKGGVYFGLGLALAQAGRRESAVRAFALEFLNDPRSALSPAWEVSALAAMRPAAVAEACRLLEALPADAAVPAALPPWLRWWWGATDDPPATGFNPASAAFVAALPEIAARRPLAPAAAAPWAAAYAMWRRAATERSAFAGVAAGDEPFAAALARRARALQTDFRAFLTGPAGDEPALVRTFRRQRPGYGVLALHPEGPPLVDLHLVQEHRVASEFAAGLLPAKGWLPGRFLLALLPDDPR